MGGEKESADRSSINKRKEKKKRKEKDSGVSTGALRFWYLRHAAVRSTPPCTWAG